MLMIPDDVWQKNLLAVWRSQWEKAIQEIGNQIPKRPQMSLTLFQGNSIGTLIPRDHTKDLRDIPITTN